MKANIVLFSTRDIWRKNTIFSNFDHHGKISSSLCDYFYEKNKTSLDNLKMEGDSGNGNTSPQTSVSSSDSNNSSTVVIGESTCNNTPTAMGQLKSLAKAMVTNVGGVILPGEEKEVEEKKDTIKKCFKELDGIINEANNGITDDYIKKLQKCQHNLYISIQDALKLNSFSSYQESFKMIENTAELEEKKEIVFKKDDFNKEEYLQTPVINTDKLSTPECPLTLRDRLCLHVDNDKIQKDNNDTYVYYAVLTLEKAEQLHNGGIEYQSAWVDTLTNAVVEAHSDADEINLILMLHDKDLYGMDGKSFHTVYTTQKVTTFKDYDSNALSSDNQIIINRYVNRSLCVFSHTDTYYQKLIGRTDIDAKKLFANTSSLVDDVLKLHYLKQMSQLLGGWAKSNEKDNVSRYNALVEKVAEPKFEVIQHLTPDEAFRINGIINELIIKYSKGLEIQ